MFKNRQKNSRSASAGFTLVELIIYMGILSVLILTFTDIFASIIDNQLGSQDTSNVSIDGRFIYSRFIYDVNRAQSVADPTPAGSTSANLNLVINGQNYVYSLDPNNNLVLTSPDGSFSLNGEGTTVSGLLFTNVGTTSAKNTVRLNFTITGTIKTHGAIQREDFQTTAGLR